jgi:hypothetical protein
MKREAAPIALEPTASPNAAPAVRLGRVVDVRDGAPLVDFPGNAAGPLPARSLVALDPDALRDAARSGREVALLFDGGDPGRPIIVGVVQSATPALDAVLEGTVSEVPEVATVDGRQVVLEGRDEVVLRCGPASITLRRDGRIVLRGAYVETHASGTNRIKGAFVKIN